MVNQTWHFVLMALASFINRQRQVVIAYLQEKNRVMRKGLGRGFRPNTAEPGTGLDPFG